MPSSNLERKRMLDRIRGARYRSKPETKLKRHLAFKRRYSDPEYRKRMSEYAKKHNRENPEVWRARHKARYADPVVREKLLAASRKWNKAHPDRRRKSSKEWRLRNPEKAAEVTRRWRMKNRATVLNYKHKRRALLLGRTVNADNIQAFMSKTKSKRTAVCYYCQKSVPTRDIHFDHILPLSKGGPHSVENLCVSCAHCNQTKQAQLLRDFVALGQQLLEI